MFLQILETFGPTKSWGDFTLVSLPLLPLRQAHSRCEMSLRTTNSQVFRPPPEMQPRQRLDGLAHGRANSSSLPGGIFGYGPVSPPPPLQPHGNSLTYASSVDGGIFGGSSGQQGRPNCGAPASLNYASSQQGGIFGGGAWAVEPHPLGRGPAVTAVAEDPFLQRLGHAERRDQQYQPQPQRPPSQQQQQQQQQQQLQQQQQQQRAHFGGAQVYEEEEDEEDYDEDDENEEDEAFEQQTAHLQQQLQQDPQILIDAAAQLAAEQGLSPEQHAALEQRLFDRMYEEQQRQRQKLQHMRERQQRQQQRKQQQQQQQQQQKGQQQSPPQPKSILRKEPPKVASNPGQWETASSTLGKPPPMYDPAPAAGGYQRSAPWSPQKLAPGAYNQPSSQSAGPVVFGGGAGSDVPAAGGRAANASQFLQHGGGRTPGAHRNPNASSIVGGIFA